MALLVRVWLLVLIMMRFRVSADELCLMVVGMGWFVADGSGVIGCVVIFVSSGGWYWMANCVLCFLSDLRLYGFGVWKGW